MQVISERLPTGFAGTQRALALRSVLQKRGYIVIACGAGILADKKPSEPGERKERSETPGLFVEAGIML